MTQIERRNFLKVAGAGSAVAVAGALPAASIRPSAASRLGTTGSLLRFSAMAELPEKPLPSHVTQVIDGTVDLARGTGQVTSQVRAGHPQALGMSIPDLTRIIRVTSASQTGQVVRLQGLIQAHALHHGEGRAVMILVDIARGTVRAPFAGTMVEHRLS